MIEVKEQRHILAFFDNGSNVYMVKKDYAESAGLVGQPVQQLLQITGGKVETWDAKVYYVPLVDRAVSL